MPRIVAFWINSFIPRDIFGLTRTIVGGPHSGKTAIPGPLPINDCFLTDQRGFSIDRRASSRMHSEGVVHIDGINVRLTQLHRCDPTFEVDCEDGDVECQQSGTTDRMSLRLLSETLVENKARIKVEMSASNPCFFGSPDIDILGEIEIDLGNQQIEFAGNVEPFPAVEAYVIVNSSPVLTLLQLAPENGATPSDLFGPPNRSFLSTIPLD